MPEQRAPASIGTIVTRSFLFSLWLAGGLLLVPVAVSVLAYGIPETLRHLQNAIFFIALLVPLLTLACSLWYVVFQHIGSRQDNDSL